MLIAPWPVVDREEVVKTFRPGSPATEGPFRTLRRHRWATAGVSVVTREGRQSSGTGTMFSALNVEAARYARLGDERAATRLAKAATQVESSAAFAALREVLTGKPQKDVADVLKGRIPKWQKGDLLAVLRQLALVTKTFEERLHPQHAPTTFIGRVREARDKNLIVEPSQGAAVIVPRWLARSAHRENIGDLLALVEEKLDESRMVVKAMPAIQLDEPAQFIPFGRTAPVRDLSDDDVKILSREPEPLRVLVPVAIER